jgi:hypothetical protein
VADRKERHSTIRRPRSCTDDLLTCFAYLYAFKSYLSFLFRLEISFGGKVWAILGI